jgi:hypothetical protein
VVSVIAAVSAKLRINVRTETRVSDTVTLSVRSRINTRTVTKVSDTDTLSEYEDEKSMLNVPSSTTIYSLSAVFDVVNATSSKILTISAIYLNLPDVSRYADEAKRIYAISETGYVYATPAIGVVALTPETREVYITPASGTVKVTPARSFTDAVEALAVTLSTRVATRNQPVL